MAVNEAHEAEGQEARSVENLGVRLKNAREAQNLSIDEVAAEFCIGAHFLRALEDCRFDALGPPVFAKGYLRQYGTRLGLDVAELVADYERTAGQSNIKIVPLTPIKLRDERKIVIWIAAGVVFVLVAAILSIWWWLGSGAVSESKSAGIKVETFALAGSQQVRVVPEAQAAIQTEPEPSVDSGTVSELEIAFIEDSWAEISNAAGERLYFNLGRAGTQERLPTDSGLSLFFGNAAGVELRIDGKPVTIPATASRGDIAQFDLDAPVD